MLHVLYVIHSFQVWNLQFILKVPHFKSTSLCCSQLVHSLLVLTLSWNGMHNFGTSDSELQVNVILKYCSLCLEIESNVSGNGLSQPLLSASEDTRPPFKAVALARSEVGWFDSPTSPFPSMHQCPLTFFESATLRAWCITVREQTVSVPEGVGWVSWGQGLAVRLFNARAKLPSWHWMAFTMTRIYGCSTALASVMQTSSYPLPSRFSLLICIYLIRTQQNAWTLHYHCTEMVL